MSKNEGERKDSQSYPGQQQRDEENSIISKNSKNRRLNSRKTTQSLLRGPYQQNNVDPASHRTK